MIVNAGYRGKVGAAGPKFTYTGNYKVRKDGVVELLTSGTIVFLEPKVIDVFCVGGGGAGGSSIFGNFTRALGGGGGGYCTTARKQRVTGSYEVTIGAGGISGSTPSNGGATSFGNIVTAAGGFSGAYVTGGVAKVYPGANGGSGGGGGRASTQTVDGTGGTDGSNGQPLEISGNYAQGGKGQGTTTREFGEQTGKLYAGGGGGGTYFYSNTPVYSLGGAGGGGAGGWWRDSNYSQAAGAGSANTGGGGGGGAVYNSDGIQGASGGSGIVCFREAQELPELAGTWKFNARIYPPEKSFDITANYTIASTPPNYGSSFTRIYIANNKLMGTAVIGAATEFYNFATNTPSAQFGYFRTDTVQNFTDEFRAWLASNATKQ